jgi:uncharacterized protein (TIGR03437 family)
MRLLWACLFSLPLLAADVAVAPQSLSFAYAYRSNLQPPQQGIVLVSTQPFTYTVSRPNADGWLIVGAGSNAASATGTGPVFLPINVNPALIGPGTFTSSLTVKLASGTVTVPVTFLVSATPILLTDPAILGFDPSSPFQQVAVGLSSGSNFVSSATGSVPWLTVRSGGSPILVAADTAATKGLAAASIRISATSLPVPGNNPLTLPVILLPAGLTATPPPLGASPAALAFTGSGSQQVTVAGPAFSALPDAKWVSVFQNGQTLTVSVNASGLAAGTYQSTITLNAGGVLQPLPVTLTLGPPTLSKVVNSASYAEGAIAPGEIVLLGGSNLGPSSLVGLSLDANGSVSTTAGGTQVTFDGVAAPMVYASATQVAVVAPYDLDGKSSTVVQVKVGGQVSNSLTVPVTAAAPGIFSADASGTGAAATFQTGDVITLYLTGEGQTTPAGVNGKVTGSDLPKPNLPVTATVGGVDAEVVYAGEAPGLVSGVMQLNLRVPVSRAGNLPVLVSVGGVQSQAGVTVSIR